MARADGSGSKYIAHGAEHLFNARDNRFVAACHQGQSAGNGAVHSARHRSVDEMQALRLKLPGEFDGARRLG